MQVADVEILNLDVALMRKLQLLVQIEKVVLVKVLNLDVAQMGLLKRKVKTLKVVNQLLLIYKVFVLLNNNFIQPYFTFFFQSAVLYLKKEVHVEIIQLSGSLIWIMVVVPDFGMAVVEVMQTATDLKKSVKKLVLHLKERVS